MLRANPGEDPVNYILRLSVDGSWAANLEIPDFKDSDTLEVFSWVMQQIDQRCNVIEGLSATQEELLRDKGKVIMSKLSPEHQKLLVERIALHDELINRQRQFLRDTWSTPPFPKD